MFLENFARSCYACAMSDLLEKDLRLWLRNVWLNGKKQAPLVFVEPAKGSTIGCADVLLPIHPLLIPVELKLAKKRKSESFVTVIRPAQKRFHTLLALNGFFSCFLSCYGDHKSFDVWLSHGVFNFDQNNFVVGELPIAKNQSTIKTIENETLISSILDLMQSHNMRVYETCKRI
jgi:hypothetical protein